MIYVFDTSTFIVLKHFYPASFPTFWRNLDRLVGAGNLVSVREVFNELHNYNDSDRVQDWAKQHKPIFATPGQTELLFVQKILAIPHFQVLIGARQLAKGTPVADPFVIASAAVNKGTVVTQEHSRPNAAKIPNVCAHFGVQCVDLERFMAQQSWTF